MKDLKVLVKIVTCTCVILLRVSAAAPHPKAPGVMIYLTSAWETWLVNEGETELELPSGEVFGFGIGAFKEVALSTMDQWLMSQTNSSN